MTDTSAHTAAAIDRLTERVTSLLEPLISEFTEFTETSTEAISYEGIGPRLSTVIDQQWRHRDEEVELQASSWASECAPT